MKLTICLIWLAGFVAASNAMDDCFGRCKNDANWAYDHCCEMQGGNLTVCCETICRGNQPNQRPCV
ncbi:hypothetical protein Plhal304r1_c040g0118711 [Plasmopara halstedii]